MSARRPMKELAQAAACALSRFDADGLVEVIGSCEALRRAIQDASLEERMAFAVEAREALQPMRNFAYVLEASVANLDVLANLSDLRAGRLEYGRRRSWE